MGAVNPDELGGGFKKYVDLHMEHKIYKLMCNYVRRIKPDAKWKKILFQNPGRPFFCVLTPSDIAYVLAIVKNGKDVWDQAKSVMNDPNTVRRRKRLGHCSAPEREGRERVVRQCGTMMGWSFITQRKGIGERSTTPRSSLLH